MTPLHGIACFYDVGFGARAVSRKTPIYFIKFYIGLGFICLFSERDIPCQVPDKERAFKVLSLKTICERAFQCKAFQRERVMGIMAPLEHLRNVNGMEGITKGFQVAQFSIYEICCFHFISV